MSPDISPIFNCEWKPDYTCSFFEFKFDQSMPNGDVDSSPIFSEPLLLNGMSWRLKIYPHGNGVARQEYISVFVELSSAILPGSYTCEYQIGLKNNDQCISRNFQSDFDVGECWGYNRFTKLDTISEYITPDNTLFFSFAVRPLTFRQHSEDQAK